MADELTCYQVADWEAIFEGAKSKGYNRKSSCQMPTKHGLGYRRLVRRPNGPALFGAWCALIQVLSRHDKPRQGYCTDTGRIPDGYHARPYSCDDLELLTDIPAAIFEEMFLVCSDPAVGWLIPPGSTLTGIVQGYHADTTRIPQGSLDSDLDLDSDSDLESGGKPRPASEDDEEQQEKTKPAKKTKRKGTVAQSPPSVDEVRAYCDERANKIDPQRFVDHYIANGWKQSNGNPLRCWKAAVRTWEGNEFSRGGKQQSLPANWQEPDDYDELVRKQLERRTR